MFFSEIVDRGPVPALVKTLAYNHARLRMIAENVANIHTPGYRTKQLDSKAFQNALREALETRVNDPKGGLTVSVQGEVQTDGQGFLQVTPREKPVENILFHDGTNMSIERQMADLAETGMANDLATTLLRGKFQTLRSAIRGTAG